MTLQVMVPAIESIVIINDGQNHNNESLSVGTDTDGTKRRILVKFNLDQFELGERINLVQIYF